MRCLLVAINSKYIHSNPAVYLLRECALRDLKQKQIFGVEVELAEYTINHHASEIFDDIFIMPILSAFPAIYGISSM